MKKQELRTQVFKILKSNLVEKGLIGVIDAIEFSFIVASMSEIKSIIGYNNYKNSIQDQKYFLSTLLHDVLGVLKNDHFFLPRTSSYLKYY